MELAKQGIVPVYTQCSFTRSGVVSLRSRADAHPEELLERWRKAWGKVEDTEGFTHAGAHQGCRQNVLHV